METPTEFQTQAPTLWQRSATRRFLVWLLCKRTLCRIAFGVAAFATLVGLFYGIENWRGKRAWNKYKQQLEAQGHHLDWAAVVPPAIPDEKNFAATRFLRLITMHPRDAGAEVEKYWPKDFNNASDAFNSVKPKKQTKEAPERRLIDLVSWQAAFMKAKKQNVSVLPDAKDMDPAARAKAATAVLEYLKIYEPVLDELRQASTRPGCRFDINYNEENPAVILLPHLARLKVLCMMLQVRAAAELALGQTDKACQDTKLMFRISGGLKHEPLLISYLVEIAMFRITTDVLWEGLAQHQWTEAQLQEFQTGLQQFDFLSELDTSFRAERAWGLKFIDYMRKKRNRAQELDCIGNPDGTTRDSGSFFDAVAACGFNMMPSGWFYWEEFNYTHSFPMPVIAMQSRRVDIARCAEKERELEVNVRGGVFQHRLFSGLLLPALTKAVNRAAEAQTVADEALVACALERYRLANGKFPEQLQALVPKFLEKVPQDVISGSPLIYRLTADGQYVLYSVGLNEKDDGGLVSLRQSTTNTHDWVWRSQPKP